MTRAVPVSASPVARTRRKSDRPDNGGNSRPENRLTIRLLQAIDVCVARIYHQTIVRVPLRLPRHGPAILICNHTSGLDPLLIQAVCPRLIVWMMAMVYYEIKAMNWLFKAIEVIPVDRGGRDLAATRSALRALEAGRILGVFPEGKIETTRDLLPFQTGVALMAIKANVPVYPAYLDGTQRNKSMVAALLTRNRATLSFGPAVEFERSATSKEVLQEATERMTAAVAELKQRSDRAEASRRPNA
jgi:1-acyl-sn-glycerol-3-phosphate acyltransferase